jgi:hypothetical protein
MLKEPSDERVFVWDNENNSLTCQLWFLHPRSLAREVYQHPKTKKKSPLSKERGNKTRAPHSQNMSRFRIGWNGRIIRASDNMFEHRPTITTFNKQTNKKLKSENVLWDTELPNWANSFNAGCFSYSSHILILFLVHRACEEGMGKWTSRYLWIIQCNRSSNEDTLDFKLFRNVQNYIPSFEMIE